MLGIICECNMVIISWKLILIMKKDVIVVNINVFIEECLKEEKVWF